MDATVSAENFKKQKLFEQQCDGEIDRISNLPEHILHYILSFLPTKYAVGTSVLSTRWNGLWKFIHNLDFCDEHLYNSSSKRPNYWKRKRIFRDFVDKVLRHNDVSNINKCNLKCNECNAAYFNGWISTIIRRKVQELNISVFKECPFRFSDCLFTCESLRILKIYMSVSMKIPASVCFSSLKVLHLGKISFFCDQSIQEISLSFPILEKFILRYCVWPKNVTFFAPILQKLEIEDRSDGLNDCEIKIYAESLVSLKFDGGPYQKYSLCHLSSLVDASIELWPGEASVHHVGSLLKDIFNVKNLELSGSSIEVLSRPDFSNHLLALSCLIHLTVGYRVRVCGRALIDLLRSMPNLESICCPDGLSSIWFKGIGRVMGTTPKCFLSNLKLVEIRQFSWIAEKGPLWQVSGSNERDLGVATS
ncbi:hypothetical protein AQUCO_00400171v1 [Aquilegia coerulea]|uniref:F-box domain-containing protein n=1 Tax=Aquilegia coerulea TaxID=218851 RepID=A0A2G5EU03_AQUCA|nr:hypothetical protein AQUCO_00400171v1 [Aquilegia coerulea]